MTSLAAMRPAFSVGAHRLLNRCAVLACALVMAACATPPGGSDGADVAGSPGSIATPTRGAGGATNGGIKSGGIKSAQQGKTDKSAKTEGAKPDDRGNWDLFGWGKLDRDAPDTNASSLEGLRADMGTFEQRGMASWYGKGFHGRKTANGERFDMRAMTAAHPSLPLDSWVLVRNLRNDKVAVVRINDRGPYHGNRVLDLSYAAAKRLNFVDHGATQVEIRRLSRTEVAALGPQIDAGNNEAGDGTGADDLSPPDTANTLVPAKKSKTAAKARTVKRKR
ncbi:septal ring lytic transglycosylase RlpA family protein [Cupriavidus plantarum]|uniref:septal ring lytic transglycosylase RlpA family protein n=1 Tax=Cupriavidus plantarum TaxID=942865 RepID=UPI000E3808CB|nr:rare lipoprotein A [Cupriavidus plantarum]REE86327.1 rare lipoprotein A [Cupriavidus plantarum]RLK29153.1 rare lipoprotein A [Cupriavidus plantarum]